MTDRNAWRRAEVPRRFWSETWRFPITGNLIVQFRDGTSKYVRIE